MLLPRSYRPKEEEKIRTIKSARRRQKPTKATRSDIHRMQTDPSAFSAITHRVQFYSQCRMGEMGEMEVYLNTDSPFSFLFIAYKRNTGASIFSSADVKRASHKPVGIS